MKLSSRHIAPVVAAIILAAASLCADAQSSATARTPVWEVVTLTDATPRPDSGRELADVAVADGKVYITVDRPVSVRVFSILGQLITQKQLAPGRHRLTLGNKGIYILKAGADTRRVNI